jgi:tRNA uridine 5-carbamoylmethylation protein Kti12
MLNTTVINILGAPGAGKTTLASELFSALKKANKDVELVSEYAKELVWDKVKIDYFIQIQMYGEQLKRESRLYNKVRYVITDSPLMLSLIYQEFYRGDNFTALKELYNEHVRELPNYNVDYKFFFLESLDDKRYVQKGRFENKEQANAVEQMIKKFLCENLVEYTLLDNRDSTVLNKIIPTL